MLILINSVFVPIFHSAEDSVKSEAIAVIYCMKSEIMKAIAQREKSFCLLSEWLVAFVYCHF